MQPRLGLKIILMRSPSVAAGAATLGWMIQIPLGFFYLFLLPPWLHGLPAVAHGLVLNPVGAAGVGIGSGVPDGRNLPLR